MKCEETWSDINADADGVIVPGVRCVIANFGYGLSIDCKPIFYGAGSSNWPCLFFIDAELSISVSNIPKFDPSLTYHCDPIDNYHKVA